MSRKSMRELALPEYPAKADEYELIKQIGTGGSATVCSCMALWLTADFPAAPLSMVNAPKNRCGKHDASRWAAWWQ